MREVKKEFFDRWKYKCIDLNIEQPDVHIIKTDDRTQLEEMIIAFPQRPPRRITSLDCGEEPTPIEEMNEIKGLLPKAVKELG